MGKILATKTFGEAIEAIGSEIKTRGMSVSELCRRAEVSRNTIYSAMKPGSSALGADKAERLATAADCTKEEILHVTILWLKNRYHPKSGATGGVIAPLLEVIDRMPEPERNRVYEKCLAGYRAAKIDTPSK